MITTIRKPDKLMLPIIASTIPIKNKRYILSPLCITQEVEGGTLYFSTLTNEIIFSDKELTEYTDKEFRTLVSHQFLVPVGFALIKYTEDIRKRLIKLERPNYKAYTILPTLDCNAHCFYCFENGRARHKMSKETAEDVAKYILDTSDDKNISISWFGGEPLYNMDAIEIITKALTDAGRNFNASMVTNGYLFTPALARKAKTEWHINKVQITLDGTKEVYNKVKAYDGKPENAYERVINNILSLVANQIEVAIRLNLTVDNKNDILQLIEELNQILPRNQFIGAYSHLIFDTDTMKITDDSDTQQAAIEEVEAKLEEYHFFRKANINKQMSIFSCKAANDNSVIILPDGVLGKCEHHTADDFVGSIYTGVTNNEIVESWKHHYICKDCYKCPLYAKCDYLKRCSDAHCSQRAVEYKIQGLKQEILNIYNNYLLKDKSTSK